MPSSTNKMCIFASEHISFIQKSSKKTKKKGKKRVKNATATHNRDEFFKIQKTSRIKLFSFSTGKRMFKVLIKSLSMSKDAFNAKKNWMNELKNKIDKKLTKN